MLNQNRATQRRVAFVPTDDANVVARMSIDVARRLGSDDVLERLTELFIGRGVPGHLRSDNGIEFAATAVREWLGKMGVKTLYIEPGSPLENGIAPSE